MKSPKRKKETPTIPFAVAFPAKDKPQPSEMQGRMGDAIRAKEAKDAILETLANDDCQDKVVSLLRSLLHEKKKSLTRE